MILFHPVLSHAIEPRLAAGSQRAYRADGVTRRLVYSLALVPIVPAASVAGTSLVTTIGRPPAFDELRTFETLFSLLWVVATISIWRKAVIWTLGRQWLTALVSFIPFIQVVVNLPLWTTSGCLGGIADALLRTGQHQLGVGAWVWVAVWVWWGWEKLNMSEVTTARVLVRVTTLQRIISCLAARGKTRLA